MTRYIGFYRGNEEKVEQIVKGQHSDQPRKVLRETKQKRQTLTNFLEETGELDKPDSPLFGFVRQAKMDNLDQFIRFLDDTMVPLNRTLVVETIKDIVGPNGEVLEAYRALWNRKIKCVFLDSEWLNTEFMWDNDIPLTKALKLVKVTVDTMNNHSLALEKAKKDVRQE